MERQRALVEGQADGLKDRNAASSGGLEDGPDIGIERGAQCERKQLVILRKTTQGRSACSEPLLVGGTAWLVTKTNRFCRYFLIIRSNFCPCWLVGSIWRSRSSVASSFAA